jgi:predicted nucleotidyltransferase component of viral defense system
MKYATPTAFRTALEERLKNRSREKGVDPQRLRRQVAFDRLLFRLFHFFPKDLLLKGGYAMELRLEKARATKDIDLVLKASRVGTDDRNQAVRRLLQDAMQKDSNDFFEFLVGEPTLDLEAVPYGGSRYPIEALLDKRLFVRFPIDVVISSLFLEPIERIESEDRLGFAGIKKMPFPAISKEQQFAEKLHAYTLPRGESENSRVKDLIDLALLMASGELKTNFMKTAIRKIFEYRATHEIPKIISPPPSSWEPKFGKLAKECGLAWDLGKATEQISAFVRKILAI